jgi:hypothetical protein
MLGKSILLVLLIITNSISISNSFADDPRPDVLTGSDYSPEKQKKHAEMCGVKYDPEKRLTFKDYETPNFICYYDIPSGALPFDKVVEIYGEDYIVCREGFHRYGPWCITEQQWEEHVTECEEGLRPNNSLCPPDSTSALMKKGIIDSVDSSKCGPGTILKGGKCVPASSSKSVSSGGCLIATATFGSEISPQVQQLRELRDNVLLQTESGSVFMNGFNKFYYLFSPTIADLERQQPIFKETIRLVITPMLYSLSLLTLADIDSESEVLGYGLGIIGLNLVIYFAAPTILVFKIRNRKSHFTH